MTPEQIKALSRQAGALIYGPVDRVGDVVDYLFTPMALIEFVRLVREQAFEEAAKSILVPLGYDDYTSRILAAERIRSLK